MTCCCDEPDPPPPPVLITCQTADILALEISGISSLACQCKHTGELNTTVYVKRMPFTVPNLNPAMPSLQILPGSLGQCSWTGAFCQGKGQVLPLDPPKYSPCNLRTITIWLQRVIPASEWPFTMMATINGIYNLPFVSALQEENEDLDLDGLELTLNLNEVEIAFINNNVESLFRIDTNSLAKIKIRVTNEQWTAHEIGFYTQTTNPPTNTIHVVKDACTTPAVCKPARFIDPCGPGWHPGVARCDVRCNDYQVFTEKHVTLSVPGGETCVCDGCTPCLTCRMPATTYENDPAFTPERCGYWLFRNVKTVCWHDCNDPLRPEAGFCNVDYPVYVTCKRINGIIVVFLEVSFALVIYRKVIDYEPGCNYLDCVNLFPISMPVVRRLGWDNGNCSSIVNPNDGIDCGISPVFSLAGLAPGRPQCLMAGDGPVVLSRG